MGGEENIQAVRQFLDLPEMLASIRFATECLFPPTVVGPASGDDPQIGIISSVIHPDVKTKILDYGAGKGRLLDGLTSRFGTSIKGFLEYVAWDIGDKDKPACMQTIAAVFPDADARWFQNRNALASVHQDASFDFVVMCNVLHEIDPKEWLDLFSPNSIVRRCLKPEGKLLIVEDYQMPLGEYTHHYGFIVLDTAALKALFDCQQGDISVRQFDEERYKGRIRGHLINKDALARVTVSSRKSAIELAKETAREEISKLRGSAKHTYKSGQAHAYWVQQFANTMLALGQL